MGLIFALTLCVVSSVDPKAFTKMYPLGIQKIAPPIPEKSRRTKVKMLWLLWSFTIIFGILSNFLTGIKDFKRLLLQAMCRCLLLIWRTLSAVT